MVEKKELTQAEIEERLQESIKKIKFETDTPITGGLKPNEKELWFGDSEHTPPSSDLVFGPLPTPERNIPEKKIGKRRRNRGTSHK